MLKMPEEMTPEELEKFEQWMFEADAQCEERKRASRWREDDLKDAVGRIMLGI